MSIWVYTFNGLDFGGMALGASFAVTKKHAHKLTRQSAEHVSNVAVRIELRIMCIPMLTQNHCTFNLSTHDERPGHGMGQIPYILGLCLMADTDTDTDTDTHTQTTGRTRVIVMVVM